MTKKLHDRMTKKLQLKIQMKRHPKAIAGNEIVEWWMLKAYFESNDHKFLYKMRDEFAQDMQINFVSGVVTRTTNMFTIA